MPVGTHYGSVAIREDLTDELAEVYPIETPLYSLSGDEACGNTIHQWLKRTLTTRQDNAQIEGNTFSLSAPTLPSRVTNLTQPMWRTFRVSDTHVWTEKAAISDLVADQMHLAMVGLKTDAEHIFWRGSTASGNASDTARRMTGLLNTASTHKTTAASGTTLTEAIFGDFLQLMWGNLDQMSYPTHVFVGGTLKRRITGFATGITKYEDVKFKTATRTVMLYDSDFGPLDIWLCRDVLSGTNANAIAAIRPELIKKAWGERPNSEIIARVAASVDGVVKCEPTLNYGDEKTIGVYLGLD